MLTPDGMRKELTALRAATDKPFNVNFFCHTPPAPDEARERAWQAKLAPFYREYGIDPLERHSVAEVMTADVHHIDANATIGDVLATHFGPAQKHRGYPVTRDGLVVGMVERDTLDGHPPSTPIGDLFGANPPLVALPGETCRTVATRLAVHGIERLPVVAQTGHAALLGVVSRSDLIKATATLHDEEHERRTLRTLPLVRRR
jgi:CBS domain-containing protein